MFNINRLKFSFASRIHFKGEFLSKKNILMYGGLLVVLITLPITVFFAQKTQIFNSRASETRPEFLESQTDQLINAKNEYYQSGQNNKNTKIQQLLEIASKRQEVLLEEVKRDPTAFLKDANLANKRDEFPEEVKKYIERNIETIGGISVFHADNFEKGESSENFILSKNGADIKDLEKEDGYFNVHSTKQLNFSIAGDIVKANGVALNHELAVEVANIEILEDQPVNPQPTERVVVFLVNFKDYAETQFTKEQINDLVFSSNRSLNSYLQANSYSKFSITGEVYGWFTIDANAPLKPSNCRPDFPGVVNFLAGNNEMRWGQLADWEAEKQGIRLDNFDKAIYVFPAGLQCIDQAAGMFKGGFMVKPRIYITRFPLKELRYYTHEYGHTLGLEHADSLTCGNKPIDRYNACKQEPGGDDYSPMGAGNEPTLENVFHFTGPEKMKMGWITKPTTTTSSGIYNINAMQSSSDNNVLAVAKPDTEETYFIEYTQEDKFIVDSMLFSGIGIKIRIGDSLLNGSIFHFLNPKTQSRLLFNTRRNWSSFGPFFEDGEVFRDDINNIEIKQISHDDSSATVEVKLKDN